MKVCKFGGTSLANAENILRAKAIVESDSARRFVVVSAPGKCADFGRKITDLLIDSHAQLCFADSCDSCDTVFGRFGKLGTDLGVDINTELECVRDEIYINRCDYDFVVSRGEYLMAVLFAKLLDYKFLDAAHFIVIKQNGQVDEKATRHNFSMLSRDGRYVMGGFYGTLAEDAGTAEAQICGSGARRHHRSTNVKTFARGGSDYTGAIVAICMGATVYENFTDTYGVQSANPAIVKGTYNVPNIDYKTLYCLSKAGATVIYPNCIPLLKKHAMTLKVDCTFDPGKKSTLVTAEKPPEAFFSITYETKQNINKDTVEILCVMNKMEFPLSKLRAVLRGLEVYLVEFSRREFRLIAPASALVEVINLLHSALTEAKSTASL